MWVVKDKRKVLDEKVTEKLINIAYKVANDKEFIVQSLKVIDSSQVDVVVSAHPKISVSYIVKMLKGISGSHLLRECPEIKASLSKGELWNSSYYIETLGTTNEDSLKQYLSMQ